MTVLTRKMYYPSFLIRFPIVDRCHFEDALSGELLSRLAAYPKLRTTLQQLPPKLIRLSTDSPAVSVEFSADVLDTRVSDVVARIRKSTFTGSGDKERVPQMYEAYVVRMAET